MEGNITVTKDHYLRLKICELELQLLNAAGVDNWEGYGEGFENFEEDKERLRKNVEAI